MQRWPDLDLPIVSGLPVGEIGAHGEPGFKIEVKRVLSAKIRERLVSSFSR